MKQASSAECVGFEFCEDSGRLRFRYRTDGQEHVVNALYHDAPALRDDVWRGCFEMLALACFVDVL